MCVPTNHAVNSPEEHRALGGRGALPEVLQHQRAVAEDVDELPEVEDPHLLQVLPLLVCGGRTEKIQQRKKTVHVKKSTANIKALFTQRTVLESQSVPFQTQTYTIYLSRFTATHVLTQ